MRVSRCLLTTVGLIVVLNALGVEAASMARPLYRHANRHGYVLFSPAGPGSSFLAAEADARLLNGSHLVTVNDAAEDAFINTAFDKSIGAAAGYWIGLTDDPAFGTTEGNFVWTSGVSLAQTGYTNWNAGEPSSTAGNNFVAKGANGTISNKWAAMPQVFGGTLSGVAEVVSPNAVADTFGTGANGTSLQGQHTEVGGKTWAANNAFYNAGQVRGNSLAARMEADYPLGSEIGRAKMICIQAEIQEQQTGWMTLGFHGGAALADMEATDGSLYLEHVRNGTAFNLNKRSGGVVTTLATTNLATDPDFLFVVNDTLFTQMVYDVTTKTVDVYVRDLNRGTTIDKPVFTDIALGTFVPTLGYAGFQGRRSVLTDMYGPTSGYVDNFAVIIPEPLTALLLGLAGLVALRRRSR